MNQKLLSIKEMIQEIYGSGFQPKNIQDCLLAGFVEFLLITFAFSLGYLLTNFYFSSFSYYPFYFWACLTTSRFIRYFFLLWKHKRK